MVCCELWGADIEAIGAQYNRCVGMMTSLSRCKIHLREFYMTEFTTLKCSFKCFGEVATLYKRTDDTFSHEYALHNDVLVSIVLIES